MLKFTFACILGLAFAGCSREPAKPSAPAPAPVVLGEPVSAAAPIALADLAKNPRAFAGRSLATSGTVTAVCQHAGCWMEIRDESADAHVRMHGHTFFIPKSASGHHARVQATVLAPNDATECAESPSNAPADGVARVELDATGVELD